MPSGYQSDVIDYSSYTYSTAMLYNLQDLVWFLWNYGNAFMIPLTLLFTYHIMRFTYMILKDGKGGLDLIGWLYVYSF
jgi:hypothetical protein